MDLGCSTPRKKNTENLSKIYYPLFIMALFHIIIFIPDRSTNRNLFYQDSSMSTVKFTAFSLN